MPLGSFLLFIFHADCERRTAMAANTSRIVVDAGGRIFHTTRDTLLMCGAGYFTALFGPTGTTLRSLGEHNNNDADDGADASDSEKADAGPSTKRSRTDPTEIFIDRDPDLFRDILNFMLSAKVRQDPTRLEDLTTEAEFFIYDALKKACTEAKDNLKKAVEAIVGDEPKAECDSIILHAQDDNTSLRKVITVPRGKVLYLVSAVLAGYLEVKRYAPAEDDESKKDIRGCYINCANDRSGDFKLSVSKDNKYVCIAHCGMNHVHGQGKNSLNVDFRQPLGVCLTGGENERVRLQATGHADWHILYWVGDAEAIPGLKSSYGDMSRRKVIQQHKVSDDDEVSDDEDSNDTLTTLLAMQLLNRH